MKTRQIKSVQDPDNISTRSPASPTVSGWGSETRVGIAFLGARKDPKFVFMAGDVTTEDGKGV